MRNKGNASWDACKQRSTRMSAKHPSSLLSRCKETLETSELFPCIFSRDTSQWVRTGGKGATHVTKIPGRGRGVALPKGAEI